VPDRATQQKLNPIEAELIACFRMLSETLQNVVIIAITSQVSTERHKIAAPVKLSLVKEPSLTK